MKSQHDHMKERYYFECHCGCNDHLLCVETFDEDVQPTIEFNFISNWNQPFFKRVRDAVKFILFKKSYGISDSVAFDEQNIEAFKEFVKVIEEVEKKKELCRKAKDEKADELLNLIATGEIQFPDCQLNDKIPVPECDGERLSQKLTKESIRKREKKLEEDVIKDMGKKSIIRKALEAQVK